MRATFATVLSTLACLIIGAASIRYVDPFWGTAIIDSLMPYATAAAALLALVAFAIHRKAVILVILLAAVGLFSHSLVMHREFAVSPTPQEVAAGPRFKVLSFNMLESNYENAPAIADRVLASGADVAIILEAGPIAPELKRVQAIYPYRLGCGASTPTCDLLLLSRQPLRNLAVSSLSDLRRDRFLAATVAAAGTDIRVVAAHLTKPYYDDYHEKELLTVRLLLAKERGPLVLAGDFNSATIAPDVQAMLRALDLNTAPVEPPTWPTTLAAHGFGIAIDHLYSRLPLVPLSVTRLEKPFGSNHFGLFGEYTLRQPD